MLVYESKGTLWSCTKHDYKIPVIKLYMHTIHVHVYTQGLILHVTQKS